MSVEPVFENHNSVERHKKNVTSVGAAILYMQIRTDTKEIHSGDIYDSGCMKFGVKNRYSLLTGIICATYPK